MIISLSFIFNSFQNLSAIYNQYFIQILNLRFSMNKINYLSLWVHLLSLFLFFWEGSSTCLQSCLNCSQIGNCLQCSSSSYIAIGSTPSKGCLPCRPGCKSCSSQYSSCITCASTFYMNSSLLKCIPCKASFCDVCDQNAPDICIACMNGYYLIDSQGTCQPCSSYSNAATCRQSFILTCQLGFYVSGGQKCLSCGLNCLKCTSSTFCTVCKDGFFGSNCSICHSSCLTCSKLSTCTTCRSGSYLNSSFLCSPCPQKAGCINCDNTGKCTKCLTNYYLDLSKNCVQITQQITGCTRYQVNESKIVCKQCEQGYFLSQSSYICIQCSLVCSSCLGLYSSSFCSGCKQNIAFALSSGICSYYPGNQTVKNIYLSEWNFPTNFSYFGTVRNVINSNCPSWKFSTKVRVKVGIISGYNIRYRMKITFSTNVGTYFGNNQYTINLNSVNLLLGTIESLGQKIYSQCSENTNSSTIQFTQLINGSINQNFNYSQLAPLNTILGNSNFFQLSTVSTNLYFSISQIIITYVPCHQSCSLCLKSNCILCKDSSFYLQKQKCVEHCSQFYFEYQNTCLGSCPIGTFPNPQNIRWVCSLCPNQCIRCQSFSSCISCSSGYFLFQRQCLPNCPAQFFSNNITSRCDPCSPPCFTCLTSNICLSCRYNFFFNNSCVSSNNCPFGFFPSLLTMSCSKCIYPCQTCLTQNKCNSCLNNTGFLYKNKCFSECPYGYISSIEALSCIQCSPQCESCKNISTFCVKCLNGFLLDGKCLTSCPQGFYENYTSMSCQICKYPCLTCKLNKFNCNSCAIGYILHEQQKYCLSEINCSNLNGSYIISSFQINSLNKKTTCANCPVQCQTCKIGQCYSCKDSYFLSNGKCLAVCPLGYYNNRKNKTCSLCSNNCNSCLDQANFCTSCRQNYRLNYLNMCEISCLLKNELYPTCQKCLSPCYTCQDIVNKCTSCVYGYFFNQNSSQCLQICYTGFFGDIFSLLCLRCNENCKTCVNSSTQCTSCYNSSFLMITDAFYKSGACVSSCMIGFYQMKLPSSNICQSCLQPCLSCVSSSTRCSSCLAGVLNIDQCLPQCPSDKYFNKSLDRCQICSSSCLSCFGSSFNECYSCRQGFYYFEKQTSCIVNCPKGYISDSLKCQICSYPCSECLNKTTLCTNCWSNQSQSSKAFYLYENQCKRSCPSGTYTHNKECLKCVHPCFECLSEISCLSCIQGKYYLMNNCLSRCPSGYYPENYSMTCRKCQYPCKTCTNQLDCLTCIDGVRLENSCSMVQSCPSGQYLKYTETNGVCQNCNISCSQCTQRSDKCVICSNESLILFNNKCHEICPSSYYITLNNISILGGIKTNVKVCQACPKQCLQCINQTFCVICSENLFFYHNYCLQLCPPGYFIIKQTSIIKNRRFDQKICQSCSIECKTCVNKKSTCLTCNQGYFLYQFKCLQQCPFGTYSQSFESNKYLTLRSGICRQCIFPCQQCNNSQNCLQCLSGYYLYKGFCMNICSKPSVVLTEGASLFCLQKCPETQRFVLEIGDQLKCSSKCQYPYILSIDSRQCLKFCPSDQFINEKLQCQYLEQVSILKNIPEMNVSTFVDKDFKIKILISFSMAIDYSNFSSVVSDKLTIYLHSKILYQQNPSSSYLPNSINNRLLMNSSYLESSQKVEYKVLTMQKQYFLLLLNPASLQTNKGKNSLNYLTINFEQNSNLLINSKVTTLPLQKSKYYCKAPQFQVYPSKYQTEGYYSVFGSVLSVFILILGGVLFIFNWYSKIYEILHYCQLLFLLSALEIMYPPNIWLFLQGFKNTHYYFITNWFVSNSALNKATEPSPKISAIFIDSNFIRVCGHIFCLTFILLGLALILFLNKFFIKSNIENVKKISKKLYQKFKLIKWSHIHDFFMTITIISLFGFFLQMEDYSTKSLLQSLGIFLSYVSFLTIIGYHIFISVKLHRIVKMSQKDGKSFAEKRYLIRPNLMSLTQLATNPKQLYLNYLRISRAIVFPLVIGSFHLQPLFCTGSLIVLFFISSLIYFCSKPYQDELQNILLGLADVFSAISLIFISVIHIKGLNPAQQNSENSDFLSFKWTIGWLSIISIIVTIVILMGQLIISIVKGNSGPMKLTGEDPITEKGFLDGAPKKIEVIPKFVLRGWDINEQEDPIVFGFKYEAKQA